MLNGELARAKEMAELADNKHEALQNLQAVDYTFIRRLNVAYGSGRMT